MQTSAAQLFEWVSAHFHMIGWAGIAAFFGRLTWLTFRGGTLFLSTKQRMLDAEAHLTKMATNCVPTIQDAALASNTKLDKHTEILESIDKNIAILVDRGRQ